jgi:hypothetical protein
MSGPALTDAIATTVTVLVADTPSTVPVTVAAPAAMAVSAPVVPVASTRTIAGSEEVHEIVLPVRTFAAASLSVGWSVNG